MFWKFAFPNDNEGEEGEEGVGGNRYPPSPLHPILDELERAYNYHYRQLPSIPTTNTVTDKDTTTTNNNNNHKKEGEEVKEEDKDSWDRSLVKLLEDDSLLSELRRGDERVISWLSKPEVIEQLFSWVFGERTGGEGEEEGGVSSSGVTTGQLESDWGSREDSEGVTPPKTNSFFGAFDLEDNPLLKDYLMDPMITNQHPSNQVEHPHQSQHWEGSEDPPHHQNHYEEEREEEENPRRKLAYVSLEILASECPPLQRAILTHWEHGLLRLWNVLHLSSQTFLPPTLSTTFNRIFTALLTHSPSLTLDFLFQREEGAVEAFITHINDPLLHDMLLKLLCVEGEVEGRTISDWFASQHLVPKLVDCMAPLYSPETHYNVSQVLLHILALSQSHPLHDEKGENPLPSSSSDPDLVPPVTKTRGYQLVKELTSHSILTRIMDYMLSPLSPPSNPTGDSEGDPGAASSQKISSLSFGVSIFIEIIRRNYNETVSTITTQETPQEEKQELDLGEMTKSTSVPAPAPDEEGIVDLSTLIAIVTQRLPDLIHLLVEPRSVREPVNNTAGEFIPLGFERLKICELIAELLHGSNSKAATGQLAELELGELMELGRKRDSYLDGSYARSDPAQKFGECQSSLPSTDHLGGGSDTEGGEGLAVGHPRTIPELSDSIRDLSLASPRQHHPHDSDGGSVTSIVSRSDSPPPPPSDTPISVGDWTKLRILEGNVLSIFMDLFLRYPWNNLLHVVVFDIIHQVLNLPTDSPTNMALIASLFLEVKITEKIVAAQRLNDATVHRPRGARLGYMGYLTFIAEEAVKCLDRSGYELGRHVVALSQTPSWQDYVYHSLRATKQRDMESLDGNHTQDPPTPSSQSADSLPTLGPNSAPSDQLSRYVCHQMLESLPDPLLAALPSPADGLLGWDHPYPPPHDLDPPPQFHDHP